MIYNDVIMSICWELLELQLFTNQIITNTIPILIKVQSLVLCSHLSTF